MSMKARAIDLKQVEQSGAQPFDYRDVLMKILHSPKNPQGGTTLQEMRTVMPILDILESAEPGSTVHLTEDQWKEVKSRLQNFPFAMNSRLIFDFADAIENAAEVDLKPDE